MSTDGHNLKEPEERNLGMIFQNLALWPHFSVKQNLEFGLKARGIAKNEREKRILEILKLLHINDYINARPSQLSGGEQQRAALARGLVLNPEIMLMDEPLSSLDFELNIRLRNEIINIQEKTGFTLVYVTHNLEEAFDIAHRVVVMKNGEISRVLYIETFELT